MVKMTAPETVCTALKAYSAAIHFDWMATLVNLLHCWATSSCSRWGTSRHATRHAIRHATLTTCRLVDLHHDGIHYALQLLLLGLKLILLSKLVLVKPIEGLLHGLLNLVLVVAFKLVFKLF